MQKLVEITPPAAEPLTLTELKLHLRISGDTDDDALTALITAAREACESYTGLALITRTYSLFLDCWPAAHRTLKLPHPPLAGVLGINIYAADDTAAAMPADDYIADTAARPGRIVLAQGAAPPLPGRIVNGIEVQYTAGYGATAADVPALLRLGMKQLAAWLYTHRGDDTAGGDAALTLSGAISLFQPYRIMRLT